MFFDIAALAFILIFSLIMMKKGGMSAILSLGGFVLSIVVASMLYPALTDIVYETPLPENLEEIVSSVIVIDGDIQGSESFEALPEVFKKALEDTQGSAVENITVSLAKTVTRLIINIIIFVLLIVVTKLVISLLSGAINLVTKLPVLHELNALVGFLCGLAISLVIVWLACLSAGVLAASNETVAQWIQDSCVMSIMSNINPF